MCAKSTSAFNRSKVSSSLPENKVKPKSAKLHLVVSVKIKGNILLI